MNKLQKDFQKKIKRNKENNRLRNLGHLGPKTGRLKVQKRRQKLFLDKICEEILRQKEEVNTSEIVIEKSPTSTV